MKSNLDSMFKADTQHELEGIWLEIADGVRFKVKRFGGKNSEQVKKMMAKHYKPFARLFEKGLLPEEKQREIYTTIFVKSSMLDWEGIEIEGELQPYSEEKAIELLKSLPDLSETLIEYASDVQNYAVDLGNS